MVQLDVWRRVRTRWQDGDLAWLGRVLMGLSAAVMIALVWWLLS